LRRTIECLQVHKLVSLNRLRVTLILGRKAGGEDSKWKFTTSYAGIPYNVVFTWTQNFYLNLIRICLFIIVREGDGYHQALFSVSVVVPDIADKINLLPRPYSG